MSDYSNQNAVENELAILSPDEPYLVEPDRLGRISGLTPGKEYRYKRFETTDDELATAMSITFIAPPSGQVVVSISGTVRAI
jgi:hypothetical protein